MTMDDNQASSLEPVILNGLYARLEDAISLPKPGGGVELDLGCGTAASPWPWPRLPRKQHTAADVMLGRLRKVMRHARRADAPNMRLLRVEARHLLGQMTPDRFLDRLHILCPDPWPKHKHKSHRLLCADFMIHLWRVLKPGGVFHFASDDVPYVSAVRSLIEGSGLFVELGPEAIADVAPFKTDFEKSWLELGRKVPHFAWGPKSV
jgi:tRNA (guanine-N7-)-methyltransferase